mmetsp:Transcript_43878/g.94504  ORF Transcript_43878/g.94504 Transcript_43878/m.94504 type:complete len:225 (-) Transcript_43878:31-705(-)
MRTSRRGKKVKVLGMVGCTAAGKSTICHSLQSKLNHCLMVCTDDHYLPLDSCPRFDLDALPWPSGIPEAFKKRGNADLNHPKSVHWAKVHHDVQAAIRTAELRGDSVVILEGLLLCADDDGARSAAALCDGWVLLAPGESSKENQEVLWRRKYTRSHLGNQSYKDRGVTEAEYQTYWDSYVWPRWLEHGFMRRPPKRSVVVDCLADSEIVAASVWKATRQVLNI